MKSNYKRLGNYIREVNVRNLDLQDRKLLGVSIQKVFMPSIANIIGTDMSTYKMISRNQLAYGPVTSRNGDKVSIALLDEHENAVISQAYTSFEVLDRKELLPEYLMMWFRRSEFDRYARFMSHGSAREIFSWEEMCEVRLPIPSIDKQNEIVKEYNVLVDLINLNNQLINKLEQSVQAIYRQWFIDFNFPNDNGKPYKLNGGRFEFNKDLDKEIPEGWAVKALKNVCSKIGSGATPDGGKANYLGSGISLVRSLNVYDYIFNLEDLAFIDNNQAKALNNATLLENDILLNITGVSVARCCMVPSFILPGRVNQHVMIIRAIPENHLSYYFLCSLCYSDNKSKLLGISQAGSTREAITKTEVEEFQLLIPDKEVARLFEQYMQKIFKHLEALVLQKKSLLELHDILLSRIAIIKE